jgi:hypothetical protein
MLDGKSPLEAARTKTGARVVEQILAKIDWGRRHRYGSRARAMHATSMGDTEFGIAAAGILFMISLLPDRYFSFLSLMCIRVNDP